MSGWQTVSLTGKAIDFKLPPDWQKQELEKPLDGAFFSTELVRWVSRVDSISIEITTFKHVSSSTLEKMAEEQLMDTLKLGESKQDGAPTDVKRAPVGDVSGVLSRMRFHFGGRSGVREAIHWAGYRIFEGRTQEIEIQLSSNPVGQPRLKTILETFHIGKDRPEQSRN